jgi:hypothetical protein
MLLICKIIEIKTTDNIRRRSYDLIFKLKIITVYINLIKVENAESKACQM